MLALLLVFVLVLVMVLAPSSDHSRSLDSRRGRLILRLSHNVVVVVRAQVVENILEFITTCVD